MDSDSFVRAHASFAPKQTPTKEKKKIPKKTKISESTEVTVSTEFADLKTESPKVKLGPQRRNPSCSVQ
jgi:hypothetical protein